MLISPQHVSTGGHAPNQPHHDLLWREVPPHEWLGGDIAALRNRYPEHAGYVEGALQALNQEHAAFNARRQQISVLANDAYKEQLLTHLQKPNESPYFHLQLATEVLAWRPRTFAGIAHQHALAARMLQSANDAIHDAAAATETRIDDMHVKVQKRMSDVPENLVNAKTVAEIDRWVHSFRRADRVDSKTSERSPQAKLFASIRAVHVAEPHKGAAEAAGNLAKRLADEDETRIYGVTPRYRDALRSALKREPSTKVRSERALRLSDETEASPLLHSAIAYASHRIAEQIISSSNLRTRLMAEHIRELTRTA